MLKTLAQKAKIYNTLLMNRMTLFALQKVLSLYRRQSRKLVKSLPADVLWSSGIEFEENHLDNTERIIERRLHASINKKKNRR
jgi:ribosomal protein S4